MITSWHKMRLKGFCAREINSKLNNPCLDKCEFACTCIYTCCVVRVAEENVDPDLTVNVLLRRKIPSGSQQEVLPTVVI